MYDFLGGLACWRDVVAVVAGSLGFVSTSSLSSSSIIQGVKEGLWVTSHNVLKISGELVISIKEIRILLLISLVNSVLQPLSMARWSWQESCALCPYALLLAGQGLILTYVKTMSKLAAQESLSMQLQCVLGWTLVIHCSSVCLWIFLLEIAEKLQVKILGQEEKSYSLE